MTTASNCSGPGGHGLFAVRLVPDWGGTVRAAPTGEHFGAHEHGAAEFTAEEAGRESVASGGSPVFLVRDATMRLAIGAMRRAIRAGRSSREAFTHVILGGIGERAPERLADAVMSVTGILRLDEPWAGAMEENEVSLALSELAAERKEDRHEAH